MAATATTIAVTSGGKDALAQVTASGSKAAFSIPHIEGPLLAAKRPLAGQDASNLGLLGHLKRIVDLDAEVANRAFQLCMSEQQLKSGGRSAKLLYGA
jgi:hypothetical protein